MKKFETKVKAIFSAFLISVMLLLNSCGGEKTDVSDLLGTVPASSGFVVGINITKLLTDLGCEVEDGEIKASKDVEKMISNMNSTDRVSFEAIIDGDTGIDPGGAIMFMDLGKVYLTFSLNDPKKFINLVETNGNSEFEEEKGVKVYANIAVLGAQGWVCLSNRYIDPVTVKAYSSLEKEESFLNTVGGEKMQEMEHDMYAWGKISTLNRQLMRGMREGPIFNMMLSAVFDDADHLWAEVDLKNGEAEAFLTLLNEKGKPAKYLLPTDKVDVSTIKSVANKGELLFAMAFSPKLLEKFDNLGSSLGGVFYDEFAQILRSIDGTIAVAFSNVNRPDDGFKGVVTTNGKATGELKQLISEHLAPIQLDGKYIRFSQGSMSGNLNIDEAAEDMKGSTIAMAAAVPRNTYNSDKINKAIKYVVWSLVPDGNGIKLKFIVKGKDSKENILLSIIKSGALF